MVSLKFNLKLLSLLLIYLLLGACNTPDPKPAQQIDQGTALGTTYSIIYEVPHDSISYHDEIKAVFDTVNASMSTYIPDSDISKINRGDTAVVVDDYFREVFRKSVEVWERTNGVFDPTVGALVNAWGFGPEKGLKELDSIKVDSILTFTGMDKVTLDQGNRVRKQHPSVFLDFNALAKGYCIDLIGRMLEEQGVENYLVEVGGEILSKGRNTRKMKKWVVAIDSPFQEEENRALISMIRLEDQAMATSGNYRKFRVDELTGEKYVHTIDPRTGYPFKNNVLSTSVIASTCMEADAYATAFMLMPLDSIKLLSGQLENLEVYVVSVNEGGELQEYHSDGFKELLVKN